MKRAMWLLAAVPAVATFLLAQGFGEFVGTVTDPSGAVIAGAKVTGAEVGTGFTRSVNTSVEGFYTIQSLRPSNYTLTVEAPGFRSFTQTGITLGADQSATVNVKLEVGATTESIQIVANSVQVDTTTSTIRQVVDESRMVELPLNGRNAAQLTLLVAGAVNSPNGGADQGQTKTFPGAVTISTNGSRQANISYRLDGGNNVDEYTNVNAPFPFPDALQEFSVADEQLQCGVWAEFRRRRERHHQIRHQRSARRCLRLLAQQRFQCAQFLFRQGRSV